MCLVLAVALPRLVVPAASLAAATERLPAGCAVFRDSHLLVNGHEVFPDVPLLVSSGRTLVPVRVVSETLGAQVEWDAERRAAIVQGRGRRVELVVGAKNALVDGTTVALDAPAVIYGSRTFVPLRFVAEALGCEVAWRAETRTASVMASGARLLAVEFGLTPDGAVALLRTDLNVPYTVKTLEDPPRLIVDLEGVVPETGWPEQALGRALVDKVRLVVTESPRLTRVVFDLLEPLRFSHRLSSAGAGIALTMQYKVSGISWQDGGLLVAASGPAAAKTFELTGPYRYVLDLPATTLSSGPQSIEIGANGVLRARTAQFQSNPDVVRIVLDLERPTEFHVAAAETGLRVLPGAGGAAEPPAPPTQPPTQPTQPPAPENPPPPALLSLTYEQTPGGGRLSAKIRGQTEPRLTVAPDGREARLELDGLAEEATDRRTVRDGVVESYEAQVAPQRGLVVVVKLAAYAGHTLGFNKEQGQVTLDLERSPLKGRRICVDPGHSASDPGCQSFSGFWERDVNYAIALAAKACLERAGAVVLMTRDGNDTIDGHGRAALANRWGAEVFVSIHCNAHDRPETSGHEVWHFGSGGPSQRLATLINAELSALGIADRGVKRGTYVVLRETDMPAVLIETGFLTSAHDERLLLTRDVQARAGDLICQGLMAFFR